MPAKGLFIAAGICLLLATVRENRDLYKAKGYIRQGEQIALLDTTTTKLTDAQKEKLTIMQGLKESASIESKRKLYEKQLRNGRGGVVEVYEQNSTLGAEGHTLFLYIFLFGTSCFLCFSAWHFLKQAF
ncbi:MAG: hypothetical protein WKF91_06275 [Segetibacter sp.]